MSYHPLKYYDHEIFLKDTTVSTTPSTGALVVNGGVGVLGDINCAGTLSVPIFQTTATTLSSSASSGAIVTIGGIGIRATADSTSPSNGGALTIGGGLAAAKSLKIGGTASVNDGLVLTTSAGGSAGASIVLAYPSTAGATLASTASVWSINVDSSNNLTVKNYNASSLATTAFSLAETTGTLSLKSKQSGTLVAVQPNREDVLCEQTFTTSTDTVASPTNVTNLVFNTSRAFVCWLVVFINATTSQSAMMELRGIKDGSGTWQLSQDTYMGDNTGVTFTITSGGQVQFVKSAHGGHVSTAFKWSVKSIFD